MIKRIIGNIKKSKKKCVPIFTAVIVLAVCSGVLAKSNKYDDSFTPDLPNQTEQPYENDTTKKSFTGQEKDGTGTSINQNTKEEKKLNRGETPIAEQDKEKFIVSTDNRNTNSNSTAPTTKRSHDGTGNSINVQPKKEGTGDGELPSSTSAPTSSDDASNTSSEEENGLPNATHEPSRPDTPIASATPRPTAKPNKNLVHDSDDASYGESENEKKTDTSIDAENLANGTIRMVECAPVENKPLCLYQGAIPDAAKMAECLSVSIRVSFTNTTTTFSDLKYTYKNDQTLYGGDYSVDWDADTEGVQSTPVEKAGTYQATVFVTNPATNATTTCRTSFTYEVYEYRLLLMDFEESFAQLGEQRFDQTLTLSNNGVYNLTQATALMNQELTRRTQSSKGYSHVFSTQADGSYTSYFGGWSQTPGGETVGSQYMIQNISEDELTTTDDGTRYYEQKLYPVWIQLDTTDSLYAVTLDKDGDMVLTDYAGDRESLTVMDIPEGITEVDMAELTKKGDFPHCTLINIPESVTKIDFADGQKVFGSLQNYGVADQNAVYMDVSGILYSKTGEKLIRVPAARSTLSNWSKKLTTIQSRSFDGVSIKELVFPTTMENVEDKGFQGADIETVHFTMKKTLSLGKDALRGEDNTLAVKHLVVADSEGDYIYLDDYVYLLDWFEDNQYTDYETKTKQIIQTETELTRDYEYHNGWMLADEGKTVMYGTKHLEEEDVVPEGVTTLETCFVKNCDKLKELTIPESVSLVKDGAFESKSLEKVYFTAQTPPNLSGAGKMFGTTIPSTIRLYVPDTKYDTYFTTWERYARRGYGANTTDLYTLPYGEQISTIDGCDYWERDNGDYILLDGRGISGEYTVSEKTTIIWKNAFQNDYRLSAITLPNDIEEIKDYAFSGCRGLSMIQVKAGLGIIGNHAFEKCSRLSKFVWETIAGANKLTRIGDYAFDGCAFTGLPDTVLASVNIGMDSMLANYSSCVIFQATCPRLRAELFTSITYIGEGAFANNSYMKKMSIPKKLTFDGYESWAALVKDKWSGWFTGNIILPIGDAESAVDPSGAGGDGGGGVVI